MHTTLPAGARTPTLRPPGATPEPDPLGGVFPSAEVRARMLAIYDRKLAEWPVHHEQLDVRTRYGRTHVIVAGSPASPPLLMVHMHACTSFAWSPIIAPLAARFRTCAVDTIGDVNKSLLDDPRRHARTGDELAAWLGDVADALQLRQPDVLAASYGGWLAMHYASLAPTRVRRLALLVPMGLPGWMQNMRVLSRLAMIGLRRSPSKMESVLSYLMGNEPAVRALCAEWFTELITSKCTMQVPAPFPVASWRLGAIRMPTLVILGGRDPLIGDPERAARRARRHIRNVQVDIVPDRTHAVHVESSERVAARLLQFFRR